jgi:hypothetical protein
VAIIRLTIATKAASIILAAAVCLLLTDVSRPSYACSCAQRLPEERFDSAAAIFAGQVVDKNQISGGYEVIFKIDRYWKGLSENDKVVAIWTSSSSASCGYEFQEGEEYLTYASRGDSSLGVNLCGGTHPLAEADNDLAILGAGTIPHDSGIVFVDPDEVVAAPYTFDAVLVLLIAAITGLSAGLAVLIIRKPKR